MIHFVGAGPGAPDLITIRGAKLISEADVIIYAGSLVNPELLEMAKPGCEIFNSAEMTLEEVLTVMYKAQAKGQLLVRLHTGDPSLFGAIREQMDALEKENIPFTQVPGVSSFCGAAATLKKEFTLPEVSQSLIITRAAGRTPVKESLRELASQGVSMAIFLSGSLLDKVQEELLAGGAFTEDTPCALVYKATWPEEAFVTCRLGELSKTGESSGFRKTVMIFVGDFLGDEYERSKLYDPEFSTEYRKAKVK